MREIGELLIGEVDAQFYIRNPHDPQTELFKKSFLQSQHLTKLLDPKVYFFIGDKGTGKTACTGYTNLFLQNEYKSDSVFFNASDFARFIEVSKELEISQTQYASLWSFVLLCLMLENSTKRYEIKPDGHVAAFLKSLRELRLGEPVSEISHALDVAAEADELFKIFSELSTASFNERAVQQAKSLFKLNRICSLCIEDLEDMGENIQFTQFVDSIDVRPDELEYREYLKVVSNLCDAVWLLNVSQFAKIPPQFKLVVILRPDIFAAVSFQNKGAKIDTNTHFLEWNTSYSEFEHSNIFKFVDQLLMVQNNEPDLKLLPGDTWRSYFPFRIPRQHNNTGDDPFIMFLRHSFYKPRDIVKYLSLMRDYYVRTSRGNLQNFSKDVFDDKEIRKNFSNYLLQEIEDQTSFYYSKDEWEQFKTFNDGFLSHKINFRSRTFDYEGFSEAHADFVRYNKDNGLHTPPSLRTSDIFLQFMFNLNIIGHQVKRTLKSGQVRTFTNWSFKQRSFANLNPKVPTTGDGEYVMHYGLAKALFTSFG